MKAEHFKEMLEPPSSVQQGIEKLIEHLRYKSPSLWHQGKTRTESGGQSLGKAPFPVRSLVFPGLLSEGSRAGDMPSLGLPLSI